MEYNSQKNTCCFLPFSVSIYGKTYHLVVKLKHTVIGTKISKFWLYMEYATKRKQQLMKL